jgi:dolichol-phosphate mannosyltransferase
MSAALWVVMPTYNEEVSVGRVVDEWLPILRQHAPGFRMCILNDGSRDRTPEILHALAARHPELLVVDKPNSGHGQTCLIGYRQALRAGAEWVLQIDSDGQCDPVFFPALWQARAHSPVVYGFRRRRDDGLMRTVISRIARVVTLLASGAWVRDANVPYRLMRADTLRGLVDDVPPDFHLANIMLAALQERRYGIRWVDIRFRDRFGGSPSVKAYSFFRQGMKLYWQLRKGGRTLRAPRALRGAHR